MEIELATESNVDFLADLSADAVMHATVLQKRAVGAQAIRLIVNAILVLGNDRSRMVSQGKIAAFEYLEYDALLPGGQDIHGFIELDRHEDGLIHSVKIALSPLKAVEHVAKALATLLSGQLGPSLFFQHLELVSSVQKRKAYP